MIPRALRFVRAERWPDGAIRLPTLQAHRGHWAAGFRENTIDAFRAAKTFEAIHALVWVEVAQVDGVGELAAYDVAHRIGMRCGVRPERVYLHAGALEGAAALGLGSRRRFLTVADLPAAPATQRGLG